jgi:hypothetical protein
MAQRDNVWMCTDHLHHCLSPLLEMSSERSLTDCYPSSFPSLKSGLYLCFFTNVWFWFGTAGKGWEAHFTPLLLWAIIHYDDRIRSCRCVHMSRLENK